MALFKWGRFKSAAGLLLDYKIECETLTEDDWHCIAQAARKILPRYGTVYSVPTGGDLLTLRLFAHRDKRSKTPLVVDDVWTTGASMFNTVRQHKLDDWIGFVAFARGPLPTNVKCFARIEGTG